LAIPEVNYEIPEVNYGPDGVISFQTCRIQGRTQGGVGVKTPSLSLIFYKNFITFA